MFNFENKDCEDIQMKFLNGLKGLIRAINMKILYQKNKIMLSWYKLTGLRSTKGKHINSFTNSDERVDQTE